MQEKLRYFLSRGARASRSTCLATPAINLTPSGINLHSGDVMHAPMFYDGTALVMTLTDTQTNAAVTESFAVNIPGIVGGRTPYVGFTAGTGGLSATQNILSWSYEPQKVTAAPVILPTTGSTLDRSLSQWRPQSRVRPPITRPMEIR